MYGTALKQISRMYSMGIRTNQSTPSFPVCHQIIYKSSRETIVIFPRKPIPPMPAILSPKLLT